MKEAKLGSAAWGFRELPLRQQLALAQKYGMRYHELGIANADTDIPLDASSDTLEQVKALYRQYGVELCCAATGNDFTGDDREAQVQKVVRVIEICAALGIEKLRIFAGFTAITDMDSERWDEMLRCLQVVAREAKKKGVTLCVETHGGVEPLCDGVRHFRSATTQGEDLLRILETADVQTVLDPANLYAVGETELNRFLERAYDRVGYIHMKDFRTGQQGQLYPCALGEGGLPWTGLKDKLIALDVPILFEYENPEDLERGLQKCITCWKGETQS